MERLCLFSHNRFHNLRNIHIMIVLFRIELAVSVLIDKICRIHGCAVHFAADEDGVSFFKCRYAVDEDRGQAGFLDFVVVTADTEPQSLRASRCPSFKKLTEKSSSLSINSLV